MSPTVPTVPTTINALVERDETRLANVGGLSIHQVRAEMAAIREARKVGFRYAKLTSTTSTTSDAMIVRDELRRPRYHRPGFTTLGRILAKYGPTFTVADDAEYVGSPAYYRTLAIQRGGPVGKLTGRAHAALRVSQTGCYLAASYRIVSAHYRLAEYQDGRADAYHETAAYDERYPVRRTIDHGSHGESVTTL